MTSQEHASRIMRRLKRAEDALVSLHDALSAGAADHVELVGNEVSALAVPKNPKPD
jgi:predicted nucleic acid-binding protein